MASDPSSTKQGAPGVRGISYPAISLEAAVKRAKQLWESEHKNAAPLEAVAAHWGYSPTSSGVRTSVAALISFGLVSDQGSGPQRKIQLTPRGLDIVLDTPAREGALRDAVLSPKIYAELLTVWPVENLPSDQTIKVHLLRNKNFNPKAVDGFIEDFRASISFSGLTQSGNMPSVLAPESMDLPEMRTQPGERSHGIRSVERGAPQSLSLAGERLWFEIDLSADVKCRLLLSGLPITGIEIDTLIEFLQFQKRVHGKKRPEPVTIDQPTEETPPKG